MIKGLIHQEGIIDTFASNRVPEHRKQNLTDLKGEIDNLIITVRDFNTILSTMDGPSRQKISKETETLTNMH